MSVREWGLGRPEAAVPDPSCKLFPKIWLYRKCPETRNENAKRLCCELHSRSVTPLEGQDSQARGDSALCLTASSRLEGTQDSGEPPLRELLAHVARTRGPLHQTGPGPAEFLGTGQARLARRPTERVEAGAWLAIWPRAAQGRGCRDCGINGGSIPNKGKRMHGVKVLGPSAQKAARVPGLVEGLTCSQPQALHLAGKLPASSPRASLLST